ncbi:hypothetical protein Droror1_Dr00001581 [Drosera rotundifolia]
MKPGGVELFLMTVLCSLELLLSWWLSWVKVQSCGGWVRAWWISRETARVVLLTRVSYCPVRVGGRGTSCEERNCVVVAALRHTSRSVQLGTELCSLSRGTAAKCLELLIVGVCDQRD